MNIFNESFDGGRLVSPPMKDLLRMAMELTHEVEAVARTKGERFNVFDILQVGHYEVRTHSPILAELLNPQGSHGQGALFLKQFITRHDLHPFDADSARIFTEYHIGAVSEDEGGRLDILIRDRNSREILIENKIYANEQENQIARYLKFSPGGIVIYLTLYGEPPTTVAAEPQTRVRLLSYRTDIIAWLEDCEKGAAKAPRVGETIAQYIQLIQRLTQQNTSARMNQKLTEAVLQSRNDFMAYAALCNARREIQVTIVNSMLERLSVIAEKLGLQLVRPTIDLSQKYGGFYLTSPKLHANNLRIGFEFDTGDYRNFFFGFKLLDEKIICSIAPRLPALFKAELGRVEAGTMWWPAWMWSETHCQWTDATFADIQFGSFTDDLGHHFERLLKIVDQACKSE
jgi:hypothetical protein